MAIRYVDIEPEEGKAAKVPKPVAKVPAVPAESPPEPAPATKPKRKKR